MKELTIKEFASMGGKARAKKLSKELNVKTLLGAENKNSLILSDELKTYSEVTTCTDDGSCGERNNAVELAKKYIEKNKGTYCLFACGPDAMLKNIAKLAKEKNIKCYVSLEEHMACGIGAFLCCAVKTTDGIERVCKEGPVFESTKIKWEEK